ncbi:MAG: SH3 domain-containing protein [Chloroflexia bacterium]|nr:SH3 domain-containing protein [Chloroflexia bacterium]
MQTPCATDTPSHAGARTTSILVAVLLLILSFASTRSVLAQDSTPETLDNQLVDVTDEGTPATGATPEAAATPQAAGEDTLGTVLMSYEFEEMPPAPLTVRLLRMTLEPGATVPGHTHPGPEFNYVESGTLTAEVDGTAVVGAEGDEDPTEVTEAQTLDAGEWIMYPAESGMVLANGSEENVVLLSAVIHPVGSDIDSTITYTDGQPTDADFEGVSFVVLGDGLIQQFPAGGATVIVDELVLNDGRSVPGYSGPALLSKAAGVFAISATEGAVQVTSSASPQLQPNAIPGQEFTLADNDAAFFPSGYDAIDLTEDSGIVGFTRLLIQPEGELANGVATVTTIQPDTTEVADTVDVATGDGLGVGALIALNEDTVNVRAEPTTASDIVDTYPVGTQFELVGGPVEAEDFVWYEVVGVNNLSDVQGWLVTDFMDVIEPATGVATGQDDGSAGTGDLATTDDADESVVSALEGLDIDPEDEEADEALSALGGLDLDAADAEETPPPVTDLEVGAIVATVDENLRIRAEASASGTVIVAVATGTELEVIGGPEEADGFTWYEVQLVDDATVTGWVASNFLEVVEGE